MQKTIGLPNWTFCSEEVSASFYKVRAVHKDGPSVEMDGSDPDEIVARVKQSIAELERDIKLH